LAGHRALIESPAERQATFRTRCGYSELLRLDRSGIARQTANLANSDLQGASSIVQFNVRRRVKAGLSPACTPFTREQPSQPVKSCNPGLPRLRRRSHGYSFERMHRTYGACLPPVSCRIAEIPSTMNGPAVTSRIHYTSSHSRAQKSARFITLKKLCLIVVLSKFQRKYTQI
jgi:hypothetical protein